MNIAIADGLDFYHTNHDDLDHLDRASVQHMGDQALGATRAFLAANWSGGIPTLERLPTRISPRVLRVASPDRLADAARVCALAFLRCCWCGRPAMAAGKSWTGGPSRCRRALLVGGGLIAFLAQFAVSLIRPEPTFWTANPQVLNLTIFAGVSLLLGALALAFLALNAKRASLYAIRLDFWPLIAGMGLSIAKAGFSIMFLIPGIVFVIAAVVGWLAPRFQLIGYCLAQHAPHRGLLPAPLPARRDDGLGMAAMFGVVEAMVLAPLLAVAGGIDAGKRTVLSTLALCSLSGWSQQWWFPPTRGATRS